MDNTDFEMPSPKRQKTHSPVESSATVAPAQTEAGSIPTMNQSTDGQATNTTSGTGTEKLEHDTSISNAVDSRAKEEDMLDVLMQHVESEAASKDPALPVPISELPHEQGATVKPTADNPEPIGDVDMSDTGGVAIPSVSEPPQPLSGPSPTTLASQDHVGSSDQDGIVTSAQGLPPGLEPADTQTIQQLQTVAEVNNLPPTSDTLVTDHVPSATEALNAADTTVNPPAEAREWETDSSPYDSDSSSDTSSDSDSSDDDEDDEYTLLDPYEQARILMAEDGGGADEENSDDEGRRNPSRPQPGLRTVNEAPEEVLPKPNITITESMAIEELGSVQAVVENTILITANTSGEYRVLESNSLLCTAARLPIGVVSETLGRVEAPLYTVRFASALDVQESGVSDKGTKIYYVPDHSTFVFTQPLKSVKGSDASNFHDEEVGDDEMEFSDDEAEAEHKRQMKLRKKGIDPATVPPSSRNGRGGRGQRGRPGRGGTHHMHSIPESDTASAHGAASVEMNYDDVEEGETDYTPLRRPDSMSQANPHMMNATGAMSPPQSNPSSNNSPHVRENNENFRGARGGRGRGSFNHNNNNRGRGRGGQNQYNRGSSQPHKNNNAYPQNSYNPSSTTSMYSNPGSAPPSFHSLPLPPPPPAAPQLTPSAGPYFQPHPYGYNTNNSNSPSTIPPSPMTPLPAGQFNFNFGAAQPYAQPQYPAQAQAQASNQWAQYHANQNLQYQQQQASGGQQGNADAIAQVQRTLEELRRSAAGGNGDGNAGSSGWNARQ